MMNKIVFIFLINIICFLSGCGILHGVTHKHVAYNLKHENSCAPRAIQKALWELGGDSDRIEISHEIKKSSNIVRPIASIFSPRGRNITMPSEVRAYFESNGFYIKKIKDIKK